MANSRPYNITADILGDDDDDDDDDEYDPMDDYDTVEDALAAGVDIDSIPELRDSIIRDSRRKKNTQIDNFIPFDPNAPPVEKIPI